MKSQLPFRPYAISRRRFIALAAGAGALSVGSGCGGAGSNDENTGDDEEPSRSDERRTTTAVAKTTATARAKRDAKATPEPEVGKDQAPGGDGITLPSLLERLPNSDGNRESVTLNHYGRAAAAAGLSAYPPRNSDAGTVVKFATALVNAGLAPTDISGYRQLQNVEYWRYEIGFSFEQIEADAYGGALPALEQVLLGAFSMDDIELAVTTDPTWSPILSRQEYQGVKYYSWGPELAVDPKRISTVHPLGRGDRMAASESRIFWTAKDSAMAELISTEGGKSNSLAKTAPFLGLVNAFETRNAHVMAITANANRFKVGSPAGEPQVDPFDAIAMGAVGDGKTYSVLVGLAYASKAVAQRNAANLEGRLSKGTSMRMSKPWSQVFTGANKVAVENSLVIAELPTSTPALWRDILFSSDSLVVVKGA